MRELSIAEVEEVSGGNPILIAYAIGLITGLLLGKK